jgi:Protein kinase domain
MFIPPRYVRLNQRPEYCVSECKNRKRIEKESAPSTRQRSLENDFLSAQGEGKPLQQRLILAFTSLGLTKETAHHSIIVLEELGLTEKNIEDIASFYIYSKQDLSEDINPTHYGKGTEGISHPVVHIPAATNGQMHGLYILCKSHQVGLGAFNKAVLAVHLETGKKVVFRTARCRDVSSEEIAINKLASCFPKYFAAGIPVFYDGPWRNRYKLSNHPKDKSGILKCERVSKVGFIMPFCEGGELWRDYLGPQATKPPLTFKERIRIAYKYSKELSFFHDQLKCVHLDQTPSNIFLTGNKSPRMADFGCAVRVGKRPVLTSTRCVAPEIVLGEFLEFVHSPVDIWSLGCILADLMGNTGWSHWIDSLEMRWKTYFDKIYCQAAGAEEDWWLQLSNQLYFNNASPQARGDEGWLQLANNLDERKKIFFPEWNNPDKVDYWIFQCLMLAPNKRPDAKTVARKLKAIYDNLPN